MLIEQSDGSLFDTEHMTHETENGCRVYCPYIPAFLCEDIKRANNGNPPWVIAVTSKELKAAKYLNMDLSGMTPASARAYFLWMTTKRGYSRVFSVNGTVNRMRTYNVS